MDSSLKSILQEFDPLFNKASDESMQKGQRTEPNKWLIDVTFFSDLSERADDHYERYRQERENEKIVVNRLTATSNQKMENNMRKDVEEISTQKREEEINKLLEEQDRLIGNYIENGEGFGSLKALAHRNMERSQCRLEIVDEKFRSLSFGKALTLKEHTYFLLLQKTQAESDPTLRKKCEKYRKYLVSAFANYFHADGFLPHEPTGERSRFFYDIEAREEDGEEIDEATWDKVHEAIEKVIKSYLKKKGIFLQKKTKRPDESSTPAAQVEITENLLIDF